MDEDRRQALADIVAIARRHALSADEIGAALGPATETASQHRRRDVVVRVLGLLGGTFVFAGICVFVALQWESMNAAARVVVTLGSGLAAFGLALLAARDARYHTASTPLFLIAAALEPTGMLVAFAEFGSGGDWRWASLVTCGAVGVQFGAIFGEVRRSTPLFLCVLFATLFWGTALDLLDADASTLGLVVGGSVLLAAIGIDRTAHRAIVPAWYLIGEAVFLYGLFDAVQSTPLELLFLLAAAGFVYASAVLHSRALLFVATAAILAYTGWFTSEHFADSVGWPLALIAFGLFMIGLSALAFRIDRDYVRVASKP